MKWVGWTVRDFTLVVSMDQKKNVFQKIVALIDPAGAKKYVTQVSLLLFSLLIATSADRCRTRQKERVKLHEYIAAIKKDLENELSDCKMNLNDCKRDQTCLLKALIYADHSNIDSVRYGFDHFLEVYQRGVFRTFPPSTFEMMVQAGDVHLIKDLGLRSELASTFSFLNRNIRNELEAFDQAVTACAEVAGLYLPLSEFYSRGKGAIPRPAKGDFRWENALYSLLNNANLRGFHLRESVENFENALKKLETYEAGLGTKNDKN
jgi:hypothetical protein